MSILAPIKARRTHEDLPPVATDEELMVWSQGLNARRTLVDLTTSTEDAVAERRARPNRPLVAVRIKSTVTTDEILEEIEARATDVYVARRRVTARRRAVEGRTSTS